MSEELNNVSEDNPRQGFLTVISVLSFISIGLNIVFGIFSIFSGPPSSEEVLDSRVEMTKSISELKKVGMDSMVEMMEKLNRMTVEINDSFYLAGLLGLLIAFLGLFGVFRMWNGVKVGFHMYIIYSLVSVVSLYLYVSPSNIPSFIIVFNLLISGLFIFMYSRNLHWMKK